MIEGGKILTRLSATELADCIRSGSVSSASVVDALLDRIDQVDPAIRAWVSLDRDGSRCVAAERDAEARNRRIRGPLHGVPVGVKDIFHVRGMVTTAGAAAFAHERPDTDATAVAKLRAAGAVILGKTATTEFAYRDPADTRNPWNLDHTPGGSSSGSAAAVGAGMLPLALGSQTVGSVIRPAGYCGTVGFKPTYGRVSCAGVIPLAWSFDTVGIFSRCIDDAALAYGILAGYDAADLSSVDDPTLPVPTAGYGPPILGVAWRVFESAQEDVRANLDAVVTEARRKGAEIRDFDMPASASGLSEAGRVVVQAEAFTYHSSRFGTGCRDYRERLTAALLGASSISARDYVLARRQCASFRRDVNVSLAQVSALLLPVAPAPAPNGIESTGDATLCAPWSYAGAPALALPAGLSSSGLPLSVQLIAAPFADMQLLKVGSWLERLLAFDAEPPL